MPFYEYLCERCGRHTELLQKISDPPATVCPHCGESALVKQVSAAGFRLKGGGWYETDFKSDGKRNLAGDAATASDKSGTGKADAASSGKADAGASKTSAATGGKDSKSAASSGDS